jgi:lysozyme
MNISQVGLDLVLSYEGYHTKLPDGRCKAYLCPAKVWTIGFGTTTGVYEGLVWTRAQAQEAFDRDIDKFEAAVNRLVTVEINQNEFDALVSFTYNLGEAGLAGSGVLRKVNAGDMVGASRMFALYNKARPGKGKPLVVMPGLVRRRAEESALFLRPLAPSEEPSMPQAVEATPAPEKSRIIATALTGERAAVGLGIGGIGLSFAEALGYGGQILPLVKNYGMEAFICVMLALAVGFALVKHFRRQDHVEGKTV